MAPLRSMLSAVLCLGLAHGCAAKVHDEVEPGYDLTAFDSYAWVTEEPVLIKLGDSQPNVRTPENEARLRKAIDAALAARGLSKVAFAEADVHVAFSVGTQVRYRLEGGRDSWVAGLEPGVKQTKGTLHVYLMHPGDEKEIWHAWTSRWLDKSEDPDVVVRDAVAKVMSRFPVRP